MRASDRCGRAVNPFRCRVRGMSDTTTGTDRNGYNRDTAGLSRLFPSPCSSIPHPHAFRDSSVLRDRTQLSFSSSAQIRQESGRMLLLPAALPQELSRSPCDTSGECDVSRLPNPAASTRCRSTRELSILPACTPLSFHAPALEVRQREPRSGQRNCSVSACFPTKRLHPDLRKRSIPPPPADSVTATQRRANARRNATRSHCRDRPTRTQQAALGSYAAERGTPKRYSCPQTWRWPLPSSRNSRGASG